MPDSNLIHNFEDLLLPFYEAEKPKSAWRVGTEAEKFGVYENGDPITYEGQRGIEGIFPRLVADYGWQPEAEVAGGPAVALRRGRASITLEPAAQLELSGAPMHTMHETAAEFAFHMGELAPVSRDLGITWLGLGFHPWATQDNLPWVPKQRYGIMRSYLPTKGSMALDMMRRTCTVQANYDYSDEIDAMQKMRVALRLSPIVTAAFANSPMVEGKLTGERSHRARVWLNVDPDRTGLLPMMWEKNATYRTYVEWALDVPMFLIKRDGRALQNTEQTFRTFLANGFQGHRATRADWEMHLNTLFPEVRLKNIIEVRSADSQNLALTVALPALWKGILYDENALSEAEALSAPIEYGALEKTRSAIADQALGASLLGKPLQQWAEQIVSIAKTGLVRQAQRDPEGRDESVYIEPLEKIISSGQTPADLLLEALRRESSNTSMRKALIKHAAIAAPSPAG